MRLPSLLAALLLAVGCGGSPPVPLPDAGDQAPDAASAPDAAAPDLGEADALVQDSGAEDSGAPDAGSPSSDAGLVDSGASDGGLLLAERVEAARRTAENQALCTAITPFYWEVGDATGVLASGRRGTITATTEMPIASASKWVFGMYVVERFKDRPADIDARAMTMLSGYTSFDQCEQRQTVAECQAMGNNGDFNPAHVDRFAYGGGHFQKYAVDLGLGALNNATLMAEYQRLLGAEIPLDFTQPQPAGGMRGSAAGYAILLRKILSGGLAMKDHLGESATCTLRGPSCPTALRSPGDEAMHYSYGHWVEDEPDVGDGAFSSAGAFGFYPWIDASKTHYGIVARRDFTGGGAGFDSLRCGRLIRKAFLTGAEVQ
jgi:hypothetical protein